MSLTYCGGYLRELREAAGLTLQAVADRMRRDWGYDVTALEIEDWEAGRPPEGPYADQAWALSRALGLETIDGLFRPEE